MQPQVIGKPISEGRIPDEKEVRVWNFVSCAGGAKGFMYCRWRPMLDGPLFGAFAPCAMDGSVTPRTEMAGKIANWANKNPEIWKSSPVKGDIGIAFVPESELFNYVQQGDTEYYSQSARGAYQAFFDSNIQPDFVALDDLAEYKIVYLPYPVMLKNQTVAKLRKYVEQGGTLISEGLPAYFGDHGHVGTTQPNYGLDEVFGARESYVEFLPDISNDLKLEVYGSEIYGHYFRQEYEVSGGKAVGHYSNGNIAAVENKLGQGRTLLIGSFPAAGYYLHHALATRDLFAGLLKMAEVTPRVIVDDNSVQARLHQGPGGTYLWVVNQTRDARSIKVALESGVGAFGSAKDLWGNQSISLRGRQLSMNIPAQDAAVVALQ
jgi:beta-galactosidase